MIVGRFEDGRPMDSQEIIDWLNIMALAHPEFEMGLDNTARIIEYLTQDRPPADEIERLEIQLDNGPRCSITGNECLTDTWNLSDPPNCKCGNLIREQNELRSRLVSVDEAVRRLGYDDFDALLATFLRNIQRLQALVGWREWDYPEGFDRRTAEDRQRLKTRSDGSCDTCGNDHAKRPCILDEPGADCSDPSKHCVDCNHLAGAFVAAAPDRRGLDVPHVVRQRCEWKRVIEFDDVRTWETACGEKFTFEDAGPVENSFQFCHHCGKPIEIVPDNHGEANER